MMREGKSATTSSKAALSGNKTQSKSARDVRAAAKLILNSIYGRTLMRERDTQSTLMTSEQRLAFPRLGGLGRRWQHVPRRVQVAS